MGELSGGGPRQRAVLETRSGSWASLIVAMSFYTDLQYPAYYVLAFWSLASMMTLNVLDNYVFPAAQELPTQ